VHFIQIAHYRGAVLCLNNCCFHKIYPFRKHIMCIIHIYMNSIRSQTKNVQNTRISQEQLRNFHLAVLEIVATINRPNRDEILIREAGIALDRALFPLLVGIERFGPIGVVEMADRVGRDYTTVSRQFAKLEEIGLVKRQGSPRDGRVRQAAVTPKGKAMTNRVDAARERLLRSIFRKWAIQDFHELLRLIQQFSAAINSVGSTNAKADGSRLKARRRPRKMEDTVQR
jgi:DNA-binding MarR family transcriptional regulator